MTWHLGRILGCLMIGTTLVGPAVAEEDEARTIMRRTFDQGRITFRAKMQLRSPGGLVRDLTVSHRQDGDESSTYMEVTAPFNLKDTRFLSYDHASGEDEHYTYVPMVKRSMRVPQWTLEQSFLGSDFFMIDIVIPDMEEYEYSLDGTGNYDGSTCRRVISKPREPEGEPYQRIVYCVDESKWLSLYTEYFDETDKLLKTWRPTKVEKIDEVWTPLAQTMRNVQSETESELEIQEIRYRVELDDEIFGKGHLDR